MNIKSNSELNHLYNIKSKYILKYILLNLRENRFLNIIRYNKNLQNKLDLGIKYYKDFYELVEVELFPIKNKYGNFIEINSPYVHIYFNDGKEEIKRNYITEDDNISKIKIIID